MKRILGLSVAVAFFAAATFHLQAQTCTNASLNGKYVISGQGDIFTPILELNLFGILVQVGQTDTTTSTVGYIVADGSGNITSARLFQATNAGVSDTDLTTNPGTYNITDCDNGTFSLTFGSTTFNYNIDLDRVEGSADPNPGLAHGAQALDDDAGRDEAFELSRTVDPSGCGSTFNLGGIRTSGTERGTSPNGDKVSAIISMDFSAAGTFSGTERKSDSGSFTNTAYTGIYTVNGDCTVTATRTIPNPGTSGAHVITGPDGRVTPIRAWIWKGDQKDIEYCFIENDSKTKLTDNDIYLCQGGLNGGGREAW
ncbi:MAG TPA: hypothetical protein VKZ53_09030 [Candidatus Angelobacter sp.]|nr:hypothetical protein [Candidatus Angelobacter sp.]